MSRSGAAAAAGDEPIADRFNSSLSIGGNNNNRDNKPDSKSLSGLGSPVSPLRTRPAASSSSSSSGSVGKVQNPRVRSEPITGRKSHSGELSGSSESSPTANLRHGHRRSGSGLLVPEPVTASMGSSITGSIGMEVDGNGGRQGGRRGQSPMAGV